MLLDSTRSMKLAESPPGRARAARPWGGLFGAISQTHLGAARPLSLRDGCRSAPPLRGRGFSKEEGRGLRIESS